MRERRERGCSREFFFVFLVMMMLIIIITPLSVCGKGKRHCRKFGNYFVPFCIYINCFVFHFGIFFFFLCAFPLRVILISHTRGIPTKNVFFANWMDVTCEFGMNDSVLRMRTCLNWITLLPFDHNSTADPVLLHILFL